MYAFVRSFRLVSWTGSLSQKSFSLLSPPKKALNQGTTCFSFCMLESSNHVRFMGNSRHGRARHFYQTVKINNPRECPVVNSGTHRTGDLLPVKGRDKVTKRKPFLQPRLFFRTTKNGAKSDSGTKEFLSVCFLSGHCII